MTATVTVTNSYREMATGSGSTTIIPSTPILRTNHDVPTTWNTSDSAATVPL